MWPLAKCISSTFVQTPSLQLGVLQSLQGSFLLCPILLSCPTLSSHSYLWWKPGQRCTSPSLSTTQPKLGIREWTPLHTSSTLHPSWAFLTRHLGCLGGMCSLPPLPLARCPQISRSSRSSHLFSFFLHDTLHEQPWRTALVALVGALVASPAWWHSWFVLASVADLRRPGSLLFWRWDLVYLSRWVSIYFYFSI